MFWLFNFLWRFHVDLEVYFPVLAYEVIIVIYCIVVLRQLLGLILTLRELEVELCGLIILFKYAKFLSYSKPIWVKHLEILLGIGFISEFKILLWNIIDLCKSGCIKSSKSICLGL